MLAPPGPADAPEIFERYSSDPEVTKYLGWPRHRTVADAEAFVAFSASEWDRWPAGPLLILRRNDGRLLGGTGLGFERDGHAVTGYVLARDAWGLGYATESLGVMVSLARTVGAVRLSAMCHPDHRASWHVLEKCGFTRRTDWSQPAEFPNLAPGRLVDVARYEIVLRDE